jgi:FixJ family two-component response regulator
VPVVHVAIVEDDAPVRRALSRVLGSRFHVTTFASAEEFLVGGLEPVPDCVVVDVHLPMMNGVELRRRMAMVKPTMQVLFITGDHDLARRGQRDSSGVWLTKPVDEQTLIEAITRVCMRADPTNDSSGGAS